MRFICPDIPPAMEEDYLVYRTKCVEHVDVVAKKVWHGQSLVH